MGTKILIKQGGIIQNGSTYVPCEFNDLRDGGYYFFGHIRDGDCKF